VTTSGGQRIAGRALSRTATLVFYLGDNHFGTLTAFVAGDVAGQHRFTSALPTQVLKGMAPILEPYLQQAAAFDDPFPVQNWLENSVETEPVIEETPVAEVEISAAPVVETPVAIAPITDENSYSDDAEFSSDASEGLIHYSEAPSGFPCEDCVVPDLE
jgi:hypothetical protein